jgi:uncharacterized membrane protein YqiK
MMMIALIVLAVIVALIAWSLCRAAAKADRQSEIAFRRWQEGREQGGQDDPEVSAPHALLG